MKNLAKLLSVTTFMVYTLNISSVSAMDVATGINLGTSGVGIEARTPFNENLYGRFGVNYMKWHHRIKDKWSTSDGRSGQWSLKGKLTLLSAPLMLDWHPVNGSGFKLSTGIAYNGNKLKARGTPDVGQGWNGRYYTVQEIGTIHAKMKLGRPIVPVVTIGYDNSFITSKAWSFNTEVGVMFVGKPKTTISVTGVGANNPQLISDVKNSINKANKYLKYFPVLNAGFKYHL